MGADEVLKLKGAIGMANNLDALRLFQDDVLHCGDLGVLYRYCRQREKLDTSRQIGTGDGGRRKAAEGFLKHQPENKEHEIFYFGNVECPVTGRSPEEVGAAAKTIWDKLPECFTIPSGAVLILDPGALLDDGTDLKFTNPTTGSQGQEIVHFAAFVSFPQSTFNRLQNEEK